MKYTNEDGEIKLVDLTAPGTETVEIASGKLLPLHLPHKSILTEVEILSDNTWKTED